MPQTMKKKKPPTSPYIELSIVLTNVGNNWRSDYYYVQNGCSLPYKYFQRIHVPYTKINKQKLLLQEYFREMIPC